MYVLLYVSVRTDFVDRLEKRFIYEKIFEMCIYL